MDYQKFRQEVLSQNLFVPITIDFDIRTPKFYAFIYPPKGNTDFSTVIIFDTMKKLWSYKENISCADKEHIGNGSTLSEAISNYKTKNPI